MPNISILKHFNNTENDILKTLVDTEPIYNNIPVPVPAPVISKQITEPTYTGTPPNKISPDMFKYDPTLMDFSQGELTKSGATSKENIQGIESTLDETLLAEPVLAGMYATENILKNIPKGIQYLRGYKNLRPLFGEEEALTTEGLKVKIPKQEEKPSILKYETNEDFISRQKRKKELEDIKKVWEENKKNDALVLPDGFPKDKLETLNKNDYKEWLNLKQQLKIQNLMREPTDPVIFKKQEFIVEYPDPFVLMHMKNEGVQGVWWIYKKGWKKPILLNEGHYDFAKARGYVHNNPEGLTMDGWFDKQGFIKGQYVDHSLSVAGKDPELMEEAARVFGWKEPKGVENIIKPKVNLPDPNKPTQPNIVLHKNMYTDEDPLMGVASFKGSNKSLKDGVKNAFFAKVPYSKFPSGHYIMRSTDKAPVSIPQGHMQYAIENGFVPPNIKNNVIETDALDDWFIANKIAKIYKPGDIISVVSDNIKEIKDIFDIFKGVEP